MLLERHGCVPIENPSGKIIARDLRRLKVCGRTDYAVITHSNGSFMQVGGGRAGCVLEWWDSADGHFFRASTLRPSLRTENNIVLVLRCRRDILVDHDEWFDIESVIRAFVIFREQAVGTEEFRWKDMDLVDPATRKFSLLPNRW